MPQNDDVLAPVHPFRLKTPSANRTLSLCVLVVVLSLVVGTRLSMSPPKSVPASAPKTTFSSTRAMILLRQLAKHPHPMGSKAHQEVRKWIVRHLTKLGLAPQIQTQLVAVNGGGRFAGVVHNIAARLPGRDSTRAILLMAHYDTVPQSSGASDDGAGVVTLLETARALKSSPLLQNDVIFLFTDGEEEGLLGAQAFVHDHPWRDDVGVVLNFEARGSHGPSAMFQTNPGNHSWVEDFKKSVPYPIAHSLIPTLLQYLPNDTDLSVFFRAGLPGLNVAYADGIHRYHTARDSIETIDPRSLQHHGSYAISLTRHFGNLDLGRSRIENMDDVYFDVWGRVLVSYPQPLSLVLGILATLVFILAFGIQLKARRAGLIATIQSACWILVSVFAVTIVTSLVWAGLLLLKDRSLLMAYNAWLEIAFVLVSLGICIGADRFASRTLSHTDRLWGTLLVFLLLAGATTIACPSAHPLFVWPLVFGVMGAKWAPPGSQWKPLWIKTLVTCGSLAPAIVMFTSMSHSLFIALGHDVPAISMILVALLTGLVMPYVCFWNSKRLWTTTAALLSAGSIIVFSVLLFSQHDSQNPRYHSLIYGFDADTKKAIWISNDHRLDTWTQAAHSLEVQHSRLPTFFTTVQPMFFSPAPVVSLPPPSVMILKDKTQNGVRNLTIRLKSQRNARCMQIWFESAATVLGFKVNNQTPHDFFRFSIEEDERLWRDILGEAADVGWKLRFCAVPRSGFTLTLDMKPSRRPLMFRVVDESDGWPPTMGQAIAPRPSGFAPSLYSDVTLVSTKKYLNP